MFNSQNTDFSHYLFLNIKLFLYLAMGVSEKIDNRLIKEIVLDNSNASKVLSKYGIDYCCNGRQTLAQSARELNLNIDKICEELDAVRISEEKSEMDFSTVMPDELINYIVDKHHGYLHLNLPIIHECAQIVAREYGHEYPELAEIEKLVLEIRDNVNRHLFKEEHIVFPYILNITEAYKNNLKIEIAPFRKIMNTLNFMELENNETHRLINKIKAATGDFAIPSNANKTFVLFYSKHKELVENIYYHMHLKNNILFPKAIELENIIIGLQA